MDTSGLYPQLGNDDPLFEIADYTQLMKTKLDDPAWTNITLSSPWVAFGAAGNGYFNGLRARRVPGGIQYQGMVKGGTTSGIIAVLPAAFNPRSSSIQYCYAGSAAGNIWMDSANSRMTYLTGPASPSYVNIDFIVVYTNA